MTQMIRHGNGLRQLLVGTIIYNNPITPERITHNEDSRTYFIKGMDSMFQPCDRNGNIHPLPGFPEGFTSGMIHLPAFVYR